MRYIFLFILVTGLGHAIAVAQHQDIGEAPLPYKGAEQPERDSLSILSAFKHGKVNGHFRYFFMRTNNTDELTDYYANAAGGGIRFETASFYGFRFAVGGSYVFNIASSDLTVPDSLTGQYNRYEIGLFDVTEPQNTDGIDRLEELYLSYRFKSSEILFGRQFINTPFLNLQDGRMRPGAVEGLVVHFREWSWIDLQSGFIYAMSPRSTSRWYSVENTFGIYPSGVNPDGSKSDYKGHVNTPGIAYLGATTRWKGKYNIQLWEVMVPNVMNTAMLELGWNHKLTSGDKLSAGVQLIRQDGIGDGGSEETDQAYFQKGARSIVYGLKFGYKKEKWESSIQYTRITSDGRYLMPREWGRDPMYTFMPRERNEGLGDVNAVMGKINFKEITKGFSAGVALGYFDLPDVKNTRLNKYGMPSYAQLNLDLRYAFSGLFEGLDIQYLFIAKINAGDTYDNLKYVFNKVDMQGHNLVLNFHF